MATSHLTTYAYLYDDAEVHTQTIPGLGGTSSVALHLTSDLVLILTPAKAAEVRDSLAAHLHAAEVEQDRAPEQVSS